MKKKIIGWIVMYKNWGWLIMNIRFAPFIMQNQRLRFFNLRMGNESWGFGTVQVSGRTGGWDCVED
tara:strand:+ start:6237 stop:6434 length:198 start_codon:yes stop_codon:yes gene_type:complete